MRRARHGCAVVMACMCASGAVAAEHRRSSAESGAASWLRVVDRGEYSRSWAAAANLLRARLNLAEWVRMARHLRGPRGAVVSRGLLSREEVEGIRGLPRGKYAIVKYETTFAHDAGAVEVVVIALDPDGAWRVAAYNVRTGKREAECQKALVAPQDCSP